MGRPPLSSPARPQARDSPLLCASLLGTDTLPQRRRCNARSCPEMAWKPMRLVRGPPIITPVLPFPSRPVLTIHSLLPKRPGMIVGLDGLAICLPPVCISWSRRRSSFQYFAAVSLAGAISSVEPSKLGLVIMKIFLPAPFSLLCILCYPTSVLPAKR
jgi:hypothetical protein